MSTDSKHHQLQLLQSQELLLQEFLRTEPYKQFQAHFQQLEVLGLNQLSVNPITTQDHLIAAAGIITSLQKYKETLYFFPEYLEELKNEITNIQKELQNETVA